MQDCLCFGRYLQYLVKSDSDFIKSYLYYSNKRHDLFENLYKFRLSFRALDTIYLLRFDTINLYFRSNIPFKILYICEKSTFVILLENHF